jgi:hypothetical protein
MKPVKPQFKCHKKLTPVLFSTLLTVLMAVPSLLTAEMSRMEDHELAEVTGEGFANFSRGPAYDVKGNIKEGITAYRLELDIYVELFGRIHEWKAGNYQRDDLEKYPALGILDPIQYAKWYLAPAGRADGWDLDWRDVQMGESAESPFKMDGLIFQAEYRETGNSKQLESILIGTNHANGKFWGNCVSTTGSITLANVPLVNSLDFLGLSKIQPVILKRSQLLNLTASIFPIIGLDTNYTLTERNNASGFFLRWGRTEGFNLIAGWPQ